MIQHRPDRPSPWLAQIRAPDGRRVSKSFKTKTAAKNWEQDQLADMRRSEWVDPRGGDITLSEWLKEVETAKLDVSGATSSTRRSLIANHVDAHRIGRWPIGKLTPEVLQRWVKDLTEKPRGNARDGRPLSPATIHKIYTIVAEALNLAVARGKLSRSPDVEVKLPKLRRPDKRFLTEPELWRLFDAMADRYKPVVLLGGYGGLRPGEALDVRWEDVDGLSLKVRGTKTAGSLRTIRIPQLLADHLREHRRRFPHVSLVVHNEAGNRVDLNHFRNRQWARAVEEAGVGPMVPHDLRHTHVGLLIAQGAHPKVISDRLGHSSIRTTLDIYGHLIEGVESDVVDRLGGRMNPPGEATK